MAVSRALCVAHMSANLRRSLHQDLEEESLRSNMSRYLNSFGDLVDEEWATFRQLQSFTTGHNLGIMFADRTVDNATILSMVPDEPTTTRNGREHLAHFMSLTRKNGYYAIPARAQDDPNHTTYLCFQILGFKPGNRKYMQKLTRWSIDEWKGSLSCAVLGSFQVPSNIPFPNVDAGGLVVPFDTVFKTHASLVQPLPLEDLFINDSIDYLHEFHHVVHQTEFDEAAVHDIIGTQSNENDDGDQAALVNFE